MWNVDRLFVITGFVLSISRVEDVLFFFFLVLIVYLLLLIDNFLVSSILSCKSFLFLFLLLLCLFSSTKLLYVVTVLPILKRGYNFSLLDCYPSKQDH